MKEILYCFIIILICVMLYRRTIDLNMIFTAIALLILMIHASQFEYKVRENFEILQDKNQIKIDSVVFLDPEYAEPMLKNDIFSWQPKLTVYVSSLNKNFINFEENLLINIIQEKDKTIAALVVDDLNDVKGANNFQQGKGFKISNQIYGPSPVSALNNSITTFSFFWYMKLNVGKNDFDPSVDDLYSLIRFNSKNLSGPGSNRNKFFEIRIHFHNGHLNPDIIILVLGKIIGRYTYSQPDYLNRWFCDGKYHLFCFSKNEDEIKFYMDNHILIETQMSDAMYTNEFSEGETQLHLDKIIKLNDPVDDVKKKLRFNLVAFGITSEYAFNVKDVSDLNIYYHDILKTLTPDFLNMRRENSKLKYQLREYTRACPFKNEMICKSPECANITNWDNIDELLDNKACFKYLSEYCNTVSSSNIKNNRLCTFLKADNIMKMAATVDSNLMNYRTENIKTNIENKKILKELQRLGLRDIYLDKSFRNSDGESSGEMNRLINDLLKTNQTVNLDTLQALHTSDDNTNTYEPIDYNRLTENNSFSNDSEFEKLYNKMLSEKNDDPATLDKVQLASPPQQGTSRGRTENDLIDLQYEDITKPNVYDHIMKKHKEKSLLDATNSWGIFDIFK
jgi:hypothetical protein